MASNEKVAFGEVKLDPYKRMEAALQDFTTALQELPPASHFRRQGSDRPMSAIMARLVAAGYRQIAEDMDAYASHRSNEELHRER